METNGAQNYAISIEDAFSYMKDGKVTTWTSWKDVSAGWHSWFFGRDDGSVDRYYGDEWSCKPKHRCRKGFFMNKHGFC